MKKKKNNCFFIIAFFFLSIFYVENIAANNEQINWRAKQVMWWNDVALVKDVLLSSNLVMATHPDLQKDSSALEYLLNTSYLLLVLDAVSSEKSLKLLASLNSYNLGETSSEIYSCLVLRKGKKISNYSPPSAGLYSF